MNKQLLSWESNFLTLGPRKYIQGATLLEGIIDNKELNELISVKKIKFSSRDFIFDQCSYHVFEKNLLSKKELSEYPARCDIKGEEGIDFTVCLSPKEKSQVDSREYDEDALVSVSKISIPNKQILVEWSGDETIFKVLIAGMKKLTYELFPGNDGGKWIFIGLDLAWEEAKKFNRGNIDLKIQSIIGGKMAKASVLLDSKPLGAILFSRSEGLKTRK